MIYDYVYKNDTRSNRINAKINNQNFNIVDTQKAQKKNNDGWRKKETTNDSRLSG